jgi:2-keto-4-pentenoate hydratase/2-oxohepta-3-ene-1,7-dioic acid hydratase in catechol pathway
MRFVRFSKSGAPGQPGLPVGDKVVPLQALAPDAPADSCDIIAARDRLDPRLAPPLTAAAASPVALPLAQVRFLAPVPRPEKIMAIGLN